ncbi:MAG: hypothetical protein QOH66_909 [Actinomycetota bacterium]|nr:hypothetical protein [Actinomycetota bacterium]MEA2587982.1 hypothetical protein [Actinomycetota bacterium]
MSRSSRIWRAGTDIALIGALATGCGHGTRAATPPSPGAIPAQVAPVDASTGKAPAAGEPSAAGTSAPPPGKPVAPAAGATQDPQATEDSQAVDRSLSQIEADLSTMDQAAASGETDVPSN